MSLRSTSPWILLLVAIVRGIAWAEGHPQRLGNASVHNLPSDERNCLHFADGYFLSPTVFFVPSFGCKFELPENTQQRTDRSTMKDPADVAKYLSDKPNNLMHSFATIPFFEQYLKGEFEFGYNYRTSQELQSPWENEGMGARLTLKGESDLVTYWAEYSFFEKEFTNYRNPTPQDQEGAKIGAELKLGILKPRVELLRFHDNVEKDPIQAQNTTSAGNVSLDMIVPQWPVLTLTYGHGQKETTSRPGGPTTMDTSTDTFGGKVWYGRTTWEAYFALIHSFTQDKLNPGSDTILHGYILGGSYRPLEGFSISPTLNFTRTWERATDIQTDTLTANLDLHYSPADGSLIFSLHGSFVTNQASDGYVDTQAFDGSIGVTRHLGHLLGLPDDKATLSFKLSYSQYIGGVYDDANREGYSVLLLFEILP